MLFPGSSNCSPRSIGLKSFHRLDTLPQQRYEYTDGKTQNRQYKLTYDRTGILLYVQREDKEQFLDSPSMNKSSIKVPSSTYMSRSFAAFSYRSKLMKLNLYYTFLFFSNQIIGFIEVWQQARRTVTLKLQPISGTLTASLQLKHRHISDEAICVSVCVVIPTRRRNGW